MGREEERERWHFDDCQWNVVKEERHQTPPAREGLRRTKNYRQLISERYVVTVVIEEKVVPVHVDGIACFVRENKWNESQRLWGRGELLTMWETKLRKSRQKM